MVQGYWDKVEEAGRDKNPYRMTYLIPVGVSETDEQAEADYGEHIEYFYHKLLHMPQELLLPPGHMTHSSLTHVLTKKPFPAYDELNHLHYKEFNDRDYLVTGSAETVTQRLTEIVKELRVGHLLLLPQFGSMPHNKAMENIERISKGVLPHLRGIWDDEGWEDKWWPAGSSASEKKKKAA